MPKTGRTTREHRFFCPDLPGTTGQAVSDSLFALDKTESHHAQHVLRLSAGDEVTLFNGRGTLAAAVIEQYDRARAICRINKSRQQPPITPTLTVAAAVPKGPRADAMVNQLSQLGVDRFVPLLCEHGVAIPKPAKVEKFARSAVESAKQSGRAWLMQIDQPVIPDEILHVPSYDLKLIASPDADTIPDLPSRLRDTANMLVLIGPEGGFSDGELAAATSAGCLPWPIAPHTLRIETAAAAAAAVLRYLSMP